jgi:hypothetical protein
MGFGNTVKRVDDVMGLKAEVLHNETSPCISGSSTY